MEYWEPTEEIIQKYEQLKENRKIYREKMSQFYSTECAIPLDEIESVFQNTFLFSLKNYKSDEYLAVRGLKRNKKGNITYFRKLKKGKELLTKYNIFVKDLPQLNHFMILDVIPNFRIPFHYSITFDQINNKLVLLTDSDLSEYGCIKRVI